MGAGWAREGEGVLGLGESGAGRVLLAAQRAKQEGRSRQEQAHGSCAVGTSCRRCDKGTSRQAAPIPLGRDGSKVG